MKRTFPTLLTLAAAGVLACQTLPVHAQDDAPPPPPAEENGGPKPGGPGGAGGDQRRQEWRQRMADRIKTQMKASDDEWSVIQPLLENVETKMRDSAGGRFGGPGGRGGPRRENNGGGNGGNGGDANRPQPAGAAETQALRQTIEADGSTTDLKAKLQAVRDQRKKSEAELASARTELKKVLNVRQEAVLVMMGVLD